MIHTLLQRKKVILASASPRRKELFKLIGVKAVQMPADIDESSIYKNPRKLVISHALEKAKKIEKKFDCDCVIIAADTIVYLNKQILGKPQNADQIREYIIKLSGNFHDVYTGIAIAYKNRIYSDFEKTKVEFNQLTSSEIEEYIKTKEPFDKAGAYGIQGFGSQFIKKISGCYFNVMGFPISLFYQMLKEIFGK